MIEMICMNCAHWDADDEQRRVAKYSRDFLSAKNIVPRASIMTIPVSILRRLQNDS